MTVLDEVYKKLVNKINEEGELNDDVSIRAKYEDGTPSFARSIFGFQYRLRPEDGPALITSRKVAVKTAFNETLAFFRDKTNKIEDLEDLGITWWDEWAKEDGTIGKSYGYQIANQKYTMPNGELLDQMDYILDQLKNNSGSRRIMFSFWNPKEDHEKSLKECAFQGTLFVLKGKLHFELTQRSCDLALGFIANAWQYWMFHRTLCHVTNLEPGDFVHTISIPHIYERHLEELLHQVNDLPTYEAPEVIIYPGLKDFYDMTFEKILIKDYKFNKDFQPKYEVSI